MIGYYVHHQGRGHLHRALAVSVALDEPVTVLSSLPRPPGVSLPWVQLDRDDEGPGPTGATDVTAGGRLHWVPYGNPGLRHRARQVSEWIDRAAPRALVADVSVEIALLARLHGVPVVSVVQPGRRDDAAHRLGWDVSDALVGLWPASMTQHLLPGVPSQVHDRVHALGALSRASAPAARFGSVVRGRRVTLLLGAGGHDLTRADIEHAVCSTPGWTWTVLGGPGGWVDDPLPALAASHVVVTAAGQNAVAEVATVRRPGVLLPQARPFDEQATMAAGLARGPWPVVVAGRYPDGGWSSLLARAAAMEGRAWAGWCDPDAAVRFADVVSGVAAGRVGVDA